MKSHLFLLVALLMAQSVIAQNAMQKGDMLRDMRQYRDAIGVYEKAWSKDNSNQDACAEVARAYVQMQDYLNASRWYEKIVDTENVNPQYVFEYANTLKSLRLYAKAKFYYQKYAAHDAELGKQCVNSCDMARLAMESAPLYSVEPSVVSTPGMEFAPWVAGEDMYFNAFDKSDMGAQSRKTKDGSVGLDNSSTVYSNALSASNMASMKSIQPGVKTEGMISYVRSSGNGKWVAYMVADFRTGQRLFDDRPGKMSIFIAEVAPDGSWNNVKPFPFNGNDFSCGYPALSADGTVLYFASTRPGGMGGWDLYVSFKGMSGWTQPQNLGSVVNTPGNEIAPTFNDHRMYFASDWHPGFGGFDLFVSTSHEGQWMNVSNMGWPLNSPKDEMDITWVPGAKTGYITSNRIGSSGQYDIFWFQSNVEEVEVNVMDQDGKMPLAGAVVSSKDNAFLPATTDATGKAIIRRAPGTSGEVEITHPEYQGLSMAVKPGGTGAMAYEVFVDKSLANDSEQAPTEGEGSVEKPGSPPVAATAPATPDVMQKPEPVISKKTIVVGDPTATSGTVSGETVIQEETPMETAKPAPKPARPIGKFAVQVAAVGKQTGMEGYKNLERYGQLMQYPENGMYKIRVGYFMTQNEAKEALGNIKTSGYPRCIYCNSQPGCWRSACYYIRRARRCCTCSKAGACKRCSDGSTWHLQQTRVFQCRNCAGTRQGGKP